MESTEEGDSEETAVSELRSELWLKERELTDIRLEALSSAHQLEHLRETMNNMHVRSLFCLWILFFSHITPFYLHSVFTVISFKQNIVARLQSAATF